MPRLCFPVCFPLVTRNLGTLSASYLPLCFSNCLSVVCQSFLQLCLHWNLGTSWNLVSHCVSQLSLNCLPIISLLFLYCFPSVFLVLPARLTFVSHLSSNCIPLSFYCLLIASLLFLHRFPLLSRLSPFVHTLTSTLSPISFPASSPTLSRTVPPIVSSIETLSPTCHSTVSRPQGVFHFSLTFLPLLV